MNFSEDPNFTRPIQPIWRPESVQKTEPQKEEPYLPWQARYWRDFDNLLIRVFDRFPDAARVFLTEARALEAKLCPKPAT